eukprot:61552-Rhodomonas_salina.1
MLGPGDPELMNGSCTEIEVPNGLVTHRIRLVRSICAGYFKRAGASASRHCLGSLASRMVITTVSGRIRKGGFRSVSATVMPTSTTDSLLLYQLRGRTLQQIGIPDAHSSIPGTLGVQNLPNSTNKLDNSTISSPTTLRGPTGSQGVHTLHDVSRPRFLQSADNDCVRLMRR